MRLGKIVDFYLLVIDFTVFNCNNNSCYKKAYILTNIINEIKINFKFGIWHIL